MAFINFNTGVVLYQNVPLDNRYINTLYATTNTVINNWLNQYTHLAYSAQSYQRVDNNVIRLEVPISSIYNYNYMRFANTNFESKTYYAFITRLEYVNNETTNVYYEVDVMMTWLPNYTLNECFVEREHSATDEIGDNILAEPVDPGDYKFTNYHKLVLDKQISGTDDPSEGCFLMAINDADTYPEAGVRLNNVFSGYTLYYFPNTSGGAAAMADVIRGYEATPEKIAFIYTCPQCLVDVPSRSVYTYKVEGANDPSNLIITEDSVTGGSGFTYFDEYLPKNNKLYTYPYNMFRVDNGSGGILKLRYEFFTNNIPVFMIYGNMIPNVSMSLVARNYLQGEESDSTSPMHVDALTMSDYPMCSWVSDYYTQWVANNSVPLQIRTNAKTMLAENDTQLTRGLVVEAANYISNAYQARLQGDHLSGQLYGGMPNYANGFQGFYGGRFHITGEFAEVIDNFFTMYGYACNKVKVPARTNRPYWNYVKTVGCTIKGNIPAEDARQICDIFDKGITFWSTSATIGDYSKDNSPS